jgi:PAS domain S-box-containing protein
MKDHNDKSSLNDFPLSLLLGENNKTDFGNSMVSETRASYSGEVSGNGFNLFKFLIENSSDGLALFEGDNLKYASPVYEKMLGYPITPETFPTLSHVLKYVHPDDLQHVENEIRNGEKHGLTSQTYQFRHQKKDGSYRWFENSITRNFDGPTVKTYVISRDIDERKQKEIQLRKSEERFKALFSQNVVGFVTTNLNANITDANNMFAVISGYKPDVLKNQPFLSLIHPEDRNDISNLLTNQIATIENPQEARIVSKSGAIIWIELFANPIKYRNGSADCIVIAIIDITWRKEAEKALHQNRTMLEAISDNTSALIFAKDINGRFTFINKAFENNFGITLKDVIGKTDFDFFDNDLAQTYRQNDLLVMKGDEACIFEEEVKIDGVLSIAISVKVPLFDPKGKVNGLCGIASDITKIKQKEHELHEVIATKEKLLSVISHDLANPLNSLYGFAQILHAGYHSSSPGSISRNISMILKSSKAMTELINTLQQWATLQRNKIKVSPQTITIRALVEASFALLSSTAGNKNIQLINHTDRSLQAYADEKMMDTVLRNLISNAVKFSNSGDSVIVDAVSQNDEIFLTVKDSGIGISPETLDNLFSINGAESLPGTNGEKGTGLGLLICKEFVELNGGKIQVESEPGKGSEFCIRIPKKK